MPEDSPQGLTLPHVSLSSPPQMNNVSLLPTPTNCSKIKGWEENCSQLPTVCGIQIHIIAVFPYIWKTKGMQAFIETHI